MKKISVILLLMNYFGLFSQVLNIDREMGSDSVFKKVRASFNFNFSNDKQKRNLVDFTNVSEIDYFLQNQYCLIFPHSI
jgi:hypothetical protein